MGRPATTTDLDPRDLSDSEPPTRQHTPADMRPQHKYSRGLLGLGSVRDDAPLTLKRLETPGIGEVWWEKLNHLCISTWQIAIKPLK